MNIFQYFKIQSTFKQLNNDIVVFSEGNVYKNTHQPILNTLSQKKSITYLTLDPNDEYLQNPHENIHPLLMDLGVLGRHFIKNISAKLFITTTPGLGALALKKSKKIQKYSYIMHSTPDIHRYAKFSFDCFDEVICSGDFQIKTLDHLERVRDFPIKQKISLGVPYYDIALEEFSSSNMQTDDKTILIAPSWGNSNFLNYYPKDLVEELLDNDYAVIFRPHPQSFKHEPQLIERIVNKHKDHPRFSMDRDISNINSMKKSSLLISSYSGMIFDYIFLTEKPCILFDMVQIGDNFEDQDIEFPSWENLLMPKIGKLVSLNEDLDIKKILIDIENQKDSIVQTIYRAKNDVANFGNSGQKIAEYYLEHL